MKRLILGCLIVSLAGSLACADEAETRVFRNEVLGLSLTYPAGWSILSADEYYENLGNVKLSDAELETRLKRNASVPLFAISRYKEPFADINPSFKINTRPYGSLKGVPLEKLANALLKQFESIFKEMRVRSAPTARNAGNAAAIHFAIDYTLVTKDGAAFAVTSEIFLIDRGSYFYMVGLGYGTNDEKGSKALLNSIVGSIEIK